MLNQHGIGKYATQYCRHRVFILKLCLENYFFNALLLLLLEGKIWTSNSSNFAFVFILGLTGRL